MGKRTGRKKTRKTKLADTQGAVAPEPTGFIWCKARGQMIGRDVCIVNQERRPEKCFGCEHGRSAA